MFPRGKCFLRMRVFAYSTDSEDNVGLLICLIVYKFYDLRIQLSSTRNPVLLHDISVLIEDYVQAFSLA